MHVPQRPCRLDDRLARLVDVARDVVRAALSAAHLNDVAPDERPQQPVGEHPQLSVPGGDDRDRDAAEAEPGELATQRDAAHLGHAGAPAERDALRPNDGAERSRLLPGGGARDVAAGVLAVLYGPERGRGAGSALRVRYRGAVAAGPELVAPVDAHGRIDPDAPALVQRKRQAGED